MKVSILIATRNRAEMLRATLEAVSRLRVPEGWAVEVIVVDNGSTDDTASVLSGVRPQPFGWHALVETRPGKSRALNTGLRQARGDVVLFTDDDVVPPADWIEHMAEPILGGEAAAVVGGVSLHETRRRPWMRRFHLDYLAHIESRDPDQPVHLIGANMAISRAFLDRVGGFDPELGPGARGFHEESLLAGQLREAGEVIAERYACAVLHYPETGRLQRAAWHKMARNKAASQAYVDYHWHHTPIRMFARYQTRAYLAWWRYRLGHPWLDPRADGIAEEEYARRFRLEYVNALRALLGQTPHYERHGLRKIRGELSPWPSQPAPLPTA